MQSIFRLPWSTEPPGMDKVAFQRSRQMPVVEIPMLHKLKRKRTDSPEASPAASPGSTHLVKKWKCANGEVKSSATIADVAPAAPAGSSAMTTSATAAAAAALAIPAMEPFATADATAMSVKPDRKPMASLPSGKENVRPKSVKPAKEAASGPSPSPVKSARTNGASGALSSSNPVSGVLPMVSPAMEGCMTRKQQVLEQEFNLAILLKHDELRLIEQELAKCQVALEQLRRCHLVPFPGTNGLSENVSLGVGPALKPQPGYTRPEAPVPWGIMDGPYTRHYAKWLIPDPKFDSVPKSSASAYAGMHFYGVDGGRSTRGSIAFDHSLGGKSRGTRTSSAAGLKLTGLGENPPPAPKIDPLIHKRSTDGQWVKLYCAECKSDKFSNTQGFLNHCRIKHNLVFKSHDAAAIACGIPIDIEEVTQGGTIALPQTANDSAPTPSTTAAATPVVGPSGSVHPLIKSNSVSASKQMPPRRVPPPKNTPGATPSSAGPVDSFFSTPMAPQNRGGSFVASPQTPYMSELLSKRGFLGNLKDIVEEARSKIDLDSIESPASDDDSAQATPVVPTAAAAGARLPANFGGIGIQRPSSQKGQQLDPVRVPPARGSMIPHPPALQTIESTDSEESERIIPESPIDLSPNTMESNPGLVSDCEDDDDEDDARSVPQIMDVDEPMDIVVEDGSDVESGRRKGVTVHRVHAEPEGLCAPKAGSPSKK